MGNHVLEAFIKYLIAEKEIDLIAIYVACLPYARQIDLYARLLKGLFDTACFSLFMCKCLVNR